MKLYSYKNCGTCKKALKYLSENGIQAEILPIRETVPKKDEIKFMLDQYNGNPKPLFNTSGKDYRELNIKDKLPTLNQDEIIDLLASNGNLIKRPFVVTTEKGWVGFKEADWNTYLKI